MSLNPARWPLFSIGFRPFFMLAILFATVAIGVWTVYWAIPFEFSPIGGVMFWHYHEMVFGFAFAVVCGFLLTAVQNWTGLPTIKGWPLLVLTLLWITARLLMAFAQPQLLLWVAVSDCLVGVGLAAVIGRNIIIKKLWRNLMVVVAVTLLTIVNAASFYFLSDANWEMIRKVIFLAILLVTFLVVMIGGRVIPFFISRRLGIEQAELPKPFELMQVVALFLIIAMQLFNDAVTINTLQGVIFALLAGYSIYRLFAWYDRGLWQEPMLWSIYLAYAFLPLGFLGFAFIGLNGDATYHSSSVHALTVGGMGVMILSMVCRVSLGHSGRVIAADPLIVVSFTSIIAAALARIFLPHVPMLGHYAYTVAGTLWVIAFGLLFIRLAWVWLSPRPDRK